MIPLPWVFCEYLFFWGKFRYFNKIDKNLDFDKSKLLDLWTFFWRSQSTEKRGCLCLMKWSSETLQKIFEIQNFFFRTSFHISTMPWCSSTLHREFIRQRIKLHEMKKRKKYIWIPKILQNLKHFVCTY